MMIYLYIVYSWANTKNQLQLTINLALSELFTKEQILVTNEQMSPASAK